MSRTTIPKSREEVIQVKRQIKDLIAEFSPRSVRNIYYRLTDPTFPVSIPKGQGEYERVSRWLTEMRERGEIPFEAITDGSRSMVPNSRHSYGSYLDNLVCSYQPDLWAEADTRLMVICESQSLAGMLDAVCRKYKVDLSVSKGFSSLTYRYDVAQQLNSNQHSTVIYLGDYDPSGLAITENWEKELSKYVDTDFDFARLAITNDQIDKFDLPIIHKENKGTHNSAMTMRVEAESMDILLIQSILEAEFKQHLPVDAWEKYEAQIDEAKAFEWEARSRMADY